MFQARHFEPLILSPVMVVKLISFRICTDRINKVQVAVVNGYYYFSVLYFGK